RKRRQDRVTILLLFQVERGVKMRFHAEMAGDTLGLIHAAASRPPHINLLQRHYVGVAACDDGCNARRVYLAIGAAAGVDIIGQYPDKALPRAWSGLLDHRSGTRLAALRSACSIDHCGAKAGMSWMKRSEEHTSELQSRENL